MFFKVVVSSLGFYVITLSPSLSFAQQPTIASSSTPPNIQTIEIKYSDKCEKGNRQISLKEIDKSISVSLILLSLAHQPTIAPS